MKPNADPPWPTEITYSKSRRCLEIRFDNGTQRTLSAEALRVNSPSAEVQGHGEGKKIITGKEDVGIISIEPVGHYAIRIIFDDGHRTGLYSWTTLYGWGA